MDAQNTYIVVLGQHMGRPEYLYDGFGPQMGRPEYLYDGFGPHMGRPEYLDDGFGPHMGRPEYLYEGFFSILHKLHTNKSNYWFHLSILNIRIDKYLVYFIHWIFGYHFQSTKQETLLLNTYNILQVQYVYIKSVTFM